MAIKVCRADDQASREIENMRNIPEHANIVPLLDAFEQSIPPNVFIVMTVAKMNLREYLLNIKMKKDQFRLEPSSQTLNDFTQMLLLGVQHLHNGHPRIIHRDIKPENCLIYEENGKDVIKLADFGVAKMMENSGPTYTDCGSRKFKAPEFLNPGAGYTEEVDLWSLGLVLYFLITGRVMETDESYQIRPESFLIWNREKRIFKQSQQTSKVEEIVEKMIVQDPKQRITPQEALQRLEMPGTINSQHSREQ